MAGWRAGPGSRLQYTARVGRAPDPIRARAAATSIVTRLREKGYVAYLAGGCVRDELLGLNPTDYDVATSTRPEEVRGLFDRTAEVGAAFGVVLVHLDRCTVEVATFRGEGPYSDSRRPDTVHFADERTDAQRRDFTINALFLDPLAEAADEPGAPSIHPRGRVVDYVGGVRDMEARVIRAVGDPDERLAEDHLRALRAVRFAARLGFEIEPTTAEAVRRHAAELRGVSRERIGEELRRMLEHPSRATSAALLQRFRLDAPTLDEPGTDCPLPILESVEGEVSFGSALAAWALDRLRGEEGSKGGGGVEPAWIKDLVRRWRGAMCLSNTERDELRACLETVRGLLKSWDSFGIAARKRLAAAECFEFALGLLKTMDPERFGRVRESVDRLRVGPVGISPSPLVTGDDLVAMGLRPGPMFGKILDQVYDAQLEGKLADTAAAMEFAGELARRLGVQQEEQR